MKNNFNNYINEKYLKLISNKKHKYFSREILNQKLFFNLPIFNSISLLPAFLSYYYLNINLILKFKAIF